LNREKLYLDAYASIPGSNYLHKDPVTRSEELASDIQELPPILKKLYFPESCKFFSNFHEVEDYCNYPQFGM
jgi:hypothetical protein